MITSIYYYLVVALFVTTTIIGLLFLTQFNENRAALHNFRLAKRLMAVAYFCVAAGNLVVLFVKTGTQVDVSSENLLLTQILTLSVSVTQAFIITIVCVMLLEPKNIKSKTLINQTTAIIMYIAIAVASYLLLPKFAIKFSIYLLNAIYLGVLIYFTVFFVRRYRAFRQVMDNFYSDDMVARMCWVVIAFYFSLGIGLFSLITTQSFSFLLNIVFILSSLCFYIFFGLKLLNYPWQFEVIEKPIAKEFEKSQSIAASGKITEKETTYKETPDTNNNISIGQWIEEKHFLKSGITIDDLADYLGTNRTYISSYFNNNRGISFRQWINNLRIEEAKLVITNNPKTTMTELASSLGYNDTRTFYRQFKALEGVHPSTWKRKNCC